MAKKIKAIKAEDVEKLIKYAERLQARVSENGEPWTTVGYARSSLKYLILQLKGEYPIL
jgi:hypothetical protein